MTQHFSHLVWLGAGTAAEPAGLIDTAKQATLVDAREAACLKLQQQWSQTTVQIQQQLITADGEDVEFTEYNLVEYSAIKPLGGLKKIFPGLKPLHSKRRNSIRVTDFIDSLTLVDRDNILVIDIIDINLGLLRALAQHGQLNHFSQLYIQAGKEVLYGEAATSADIIHFLQQHGYLAQQTSQNDPDLPLLCFSINPLWQTLQQSKDEFGKSLETIKQQLIDEKLVFEQKAMQYQVTLAEQEQQFSQQINDLTQRLNAATSENHSLQQQLETTRSNAKNALDEYTKNQEIMTAELATLQKAHLEAKSTLELKCAELEQQLKNTNITAANEKALSIENVKTKETELAKITQQRDDLNAQIPTLQNQLRDVTAAQEATKIELQKLQTELINQKQQFAVTEQEQLKIISKLQNEIELANKHSANRLESINALEIKNQTLHQTNEQLTAQNQALKREMLKAEAQIEIIKDLLLKELN